MRSITSFACLVLLAPAAGCALTSSDLAETEASSATTYVDILDFAKTDQGQWYDLVQALDAQFAAGCAGSCQAPFEHLTPLTLGCSVSSKRGDVHACSWTFAAGAVAVDPASAALATEAPTFQCPIVANTTAPHLIALLAGSADPLHEPLFGSPSLADQLAGCFAHPIGDSPLPAPGVDATTYVTASAYYASGAWQARWTAAVASLVEGFEDVCGDTFCGSDFGDLASLTFDCAVTRSTGNVKSCTWLFGGSFHTVDAHGALDETSQTFRCDVAVHGTIAELMTAVTGPDATHRALPGGTATAYDALGGCLP